MLPLMWLVLNQNMEVDRNDEENVNTPADVEETAAKTTLDVLSLKSRLMYEKRHQEFVNFCESHNLSKYSESVLIAYFREQAKIIKFPSLWSLYSMLKTTLSIKNNVDIGKFKKLVAFIKRKGIGYQPNKSKILSREEITRFLKEAPDENFLMIKVALIFGICGACRRHELYDLGPENIIELDNTLIITIPDTKTQKSRTFTVINVKGSDIDYLGLYRKYSSLRTNKEAGKKRFFLKYVDGCCSNQVVGINTFGNLPKIIATYLNLEDTHLYTGHCFRRSSVNLLADKGVNLTDIKKHRGWKSSSAEDYVDDVPLSNKIETTMKILEDSAGPSTRTRNHNAYFNKEISKESSNNCDNLSVEDFGKVCRTCLAFSSEGQMKNLYPNAENVTGEKSLLEMLMAVTFLQFSENEVLPLQICLNCEKEIIRSYNFSQKCLEVDTKLKKCVEDDETRKPVQIIPSQEKKEDDDDYENEKNDEILISPPQENEINEQTLQTVHLQKNKSEYSEVDKLRNCLKRNFKSKILNKINLSTNQNEENSLENTEIKLEIEEEDEYTTNINFETCYIKPEKIFKEEYIDQDETVSTNIFQRLEQTETEDKIDRCDGNSSQSENSDSDNKQAKVAKITVKPNSKLFGAECKKCEHPRKKRIACRVYNEMGVLSSEQVFGCEICGKQFGVKDNLTRHTVTHSGDKPH